MSLPAFLLSETTVSADGISPTLDLGQSDLGQSDLGQSDLGRIAQIPKGVLITLGLSGVIEQESLLVSIHGSTDNIEWSPDPLVQFPQKFYTGVSAVFIDAGKRSVRFLQARWKTDRWGRGSKTPMFRLYLLAEPIND